MALKIFEYRETGQTKRFIHVYKILKIESFIPMETLRVCRHQNETHSENWGQRLISGYRLTGNWSRPHHYYRPSVSSKVMKHYGRRSQWPVHVAHDDGDDDDDVVVGMSMMIMNNSSIM